MVRRFLQSLSLFLSLFHGPVHHDHPHENEDGYEHRIVVVANVSH